MIELKEHLKSILKDGFTVANTKSNKIILFDLDDTIIHTTAEIGVVKDGVIIKKLSNDVNKILNSTPAFLSLLL